MADTTQRIIPEGVRDGLIQGPKKDDASLRPETHAEATALALVGLGQAMVRVDDPLHRSHREDISEDVLADYAEGYLEEDEGARVEEILEACIICRGLLQGIRYELDALDQAAGAEDLADLDQAAGAVERVDPTLGSDNPIGAHIWRHEDPLGTDDTTKEMLLELRVYWGDMIRDVRYLSSKDGPLTLGVDKGDLFINPTHLPQTPFPLLTLQGSGRATLRFSPSMRGYVERDGVQISLETLITQGSATPESQGTRFAIPLGPKDRFLLTVGGERLTGTFIHDHIPLERGPILKPPIAGGLGALALAMAMALFVFLTQGPVTEPEPLPQRARFAQAKINYGGERVQLSGPGLSIEDIDEAIQTQSAGIQYCYGQGLKRDPKLSGALTVRLDVSGDGAVAEAAIAQSTLGDPEVEGCVVERIKATSFPPTEGGALVTVLYPIAFSTEAAG